MAEQSRYPEAQKRTSMNPDTQQSSSSSSTTSRSTSGSYAGLDVAGRKDLQGLINTLIYGTATPAEETLYTDAKGKKYTKAEYDMQQLLSLTPGALPITPSSRISASPTFAGTEAQAAQGKSRVALLGSIEELLQKYSPESAQADTLTAMQYNLQKSLEANMPTIQRGIESAGTSGGSMQALLAQDLANRSAGEAATLGLKARTDYGQISADLSRTLGDVTTRQDPVVEALLKAIAQTQTQSQSAYSSSTATQQAQSAPVGVSNPSVFDTSEARSVTPSARMPTLSSSPSYAPSYQSAQPMKKGSGFVSTPWSTTLFGDTTEEDVARALLGGGY